MHAGPMRTSVHRLDDLIVPRFFWLLFMLHASLYSMYGLPVSTWQGQGQDKKVWAGGTLGLAQGGLGAGAFANAKTAGSPAPQRTRAPAPRGWRTRGSAP